jgi:hypothetical protein
MEKRGKRGKREKRGKRGKRERFEQIPVHSTQRYNYCLIKGMLLELLEKLPVSSRKQNYTRLEA